jgi:hypothetical protein
MGMIAGDCRLAGDSTDNAKKPVTLSTKEARLLGILLYKALEGQA